MELGGEFRKTYTGHDIAPVLFVQVLSLEASEASEGDMCCVNKFDVLFVAILLDDASKSLSCTVS